MFGDPTVVPGGKSLPFYASYRISLRKAGSVKTDAEVMVPGDEPGKLKKSKVKEVSGYKIKAVVEKSKLSAPFRETMLYFDLTTGKIDEVGFLVSTGMEKGWVTLTGQMYRVMDHDPQRGLSNLRGWLDQHPEVVDEMRAKAVEEFASGSHGAAKKRVVRRKRTSSND
jgi:recombination protein RecA